MYNTILLKFAFVSFFFVFISWGKLDSQIQKNSDIRENNPQEQEIIMETAFGVLLATDKAFYKTDEAIAIELTLFNRSDKEITFHFTSGQRYDFFIENEAGKTVWHWSNDRVFVQILGDETIGPGREEIVYRESYKGRLDPGAYRVRGVLTAKNYRMSASIVVNVIS